MEKVYDIIIIGGGTAGMTAAIYGCRLGKRILIIEKNFFGGQIISTPEIENYPAFPSANGYTFATGLHSQIEALNAEQVSDEVTGLKRVAASSEMADAAQANASSEMIGATHADASGGMANPEQADTADDIKSAKQTNASGFWRIICKKSLYSARTVIIASGTESRKLGLAGEDKLLGHGISHCATCDGALYKNRTVAVVGGGNTALEEALYLSLLCRKVYLIHRRSVFTGDLSLQQRIYNTDNVQLLLNSRIVALNGKDRLQSVELCACGQNSAADTSSGTNGNAKRNDSVNADTANSNISGNKRSETNGHAANNNAKRNDPIRAGVFNSNASGNRPLSENTTSGVSENMDGGSAETLQIDALFVAIGQIPQNQPFAGTVALDPHGYIIAGEDCHTDASGVFAAGDCRTKDLRQLVTAASDGAIAATEAIKYLR